MNTGTDISAEAIFELQKILNEMNNSTEIKDNFRKLQLIEDPEAKMKFLDEMPELKMRLDKLADIIGKDNVYR